MPASLCVMPPAKSLADEGRQDAGERAGRAAATALGTSCWAAVNSALVDGVATGAGAWPKFAAVVVTVGVVPSLTVEPSLGTAA